MNAEDERLFRQPRPLPQHPLKGKTPMLAVLAFIVFVIAGILKLVGRHSDWLIWLLITGGALISAHGIWGWAGPRWGSRTGPAA